MVAAEGRLQCRGRHVLGSEYRPLTAEVGNAYCLQYCCMHGTPASMNLTVATRLVGCSRPACMYASTSQTLCRHRLCRKASDCLWPAHADLNSMSCQALLSRQKRRTLISSTGSTGIIARCASSHGDAQHLLPHSSACRGLGTRRQRHRLLPNSSTGASMRHQSGTGSGRPSSGATDRRSVKALRR